MDQNSCLNFKYTGVNMNNIKIIIWLALIISINVDIYSQTDQKFKSIFDEPVFEDRTVEKKESNIKNKFSFEVYAENGYNSSTGWYSKDAVGFEYYGILSDEKGDYLDINLQMRFLFNSEWLEDSHIFAYGDFTGWSDFNKVIQFHNAFLRFRFLQGYLNVLVGHYDNLYGLEVNTDTHSTMAQKLIFYDFNMKKDWGLYLNGQADSFDWWLSFTIGSGLGIHWEGGQYLISGRIATPEDNTLVGLSVLYGKILPVMGSNLRANKSLEVLRMVLDLRHQFSSFTLDGEISGGWKESFTKSNGVVLVYSWKPDLYSLFHFSYIPADLLDLKFTIGPRMELVDISSLNSESTITLENYIRYQWFSEFSLELGFLPELYNSDKTEEWEIKLLAYLSI